MGPQVEAQEVAKTGTSSSSVSPEKHPRSRSKSERPTSRKKTERRSSKKRKDGFKGEKVGAPESEYAHLSEAAMAFKRLGSMGLKGFSDTALKELCSQGFTGETYYDFDKGFDRQHPLLIIHFNDVYNIEPAADGSGGIARFVSALRTYRDDNPLILFSGDAFNPSFVSMITKGRHMVNFLNMLKIHTACIGNHEFDFGVDHLEYLSGSCQFPWLLSNVFDAFVPQKPIAEASLYRLFEWQGHRVGVMGLVEKEWLSTLATINEDEVDYVDYVEQANRLSKVFRAKECDLIIALTHMRSPNDERLAREAEDIDIILGGHDHEYYGVRRLGNSIVAKSGTDFRTFTVIKILPGVKLHSKLAKLAYDPHNFPPNTLVPGNRGGGAYLMPNFSGGSVAEWKCVDCLKHPPNRHVRVLVEKYMKELDQQMDKVLGENAVPLETRFGKIRTEECNVGNWLCDLMRFNMKADIALLNSGTVRSDTVFPPGKFTLRHLFAMLPMVDDLIVIEVTDKQLIQSLENSVSQWPTREGRFLQVSGVKFCFDPEQPPGQRVQSVQVCSRDSHSLAIDYRNLEKGETLSVCTKAYLAEGKDGYDCLKGCKVLKTSEDCVPLSTLVQNSFSLAAMASGLRRPRTIATLRKLDTFRGLTTEEQIALCGMTLTEAGHFELSIHVEGRIQNTRNTSQASSL